MHLPINGAMPHRCRWVIGPDEVVALPVCRRSNWSWREPATTVRADVLQHLFDAGPTECALEAANHRIASLGRQRLAVLAGRSKFKGHCCLLMHDSLYSYAVVPHTLHRLLRLGLRIGCQRFERLR